MSKDLNKDFNEYRRVIPSEKEVNTTGEEENTTEEEITRIISIHSSYKNADSGTHKVLGLLADTINLIELQTRNSFLFMFEYFCFLPQLGGKENKFTLTLLDDKDAEPFTKGTASPRDYKNLFIYKAHQLLFEDLRNFLYRGKVEFSLSGQRTDAFCGEIMEKEYNKSGEIVSFTNLFSWPSPSGVTLISWKKEPISKENVENVFAFFRNATYVRSGRIEYDMYLDNLQRFLNSLEMLPEEYFTAFYKIELPFDSTFRDMVSTLSLITRKESIGQCLEVKMEHLSTGEYQQSIFFAAIIRKFECSFQEQRNRNLIFLFDEPEMHLHPMASQKFLENLEKVFDAFKTKGLAENFQIIMATHSPFLVQKISKLPSTISLVEKNHNAISVRDFENMNELKLPYREEYSFNLVMHKIFGMTTVELHNELYGYLQEKTNQTRVLDFDLHIYKMLTEEEINYLLKDSSNGKTNYKTLTTYIRNTIHHPNEGKSYTEAELEQSIQLLERLCEELK